MTMLLACLMVIGVTFTANASPKNTLEDTGYDFAMDQVTPTIGTSTFKYYTIANASKKVPATNMWIRTNSATIDLSGMGG